MIPTSAFAWTNCIGFLLVSFCQNSWTLGQEAGLRAGMIGLDTSHAIAFTTSLNRGPKNEADREKLSGIKVVAAYPQGSRDIESSTKRVPEYTAKMSELGVEIVESIETLLAKVDVVFLESNDGRVHLEQLQPILKARKPVFIDKPLAGDLADVIRILDTLHQADVPGFCSSSLRFAKATQQARAGAIGKVVQAETFSPASLEPTHTPLYWYGIHGCEALFTAMGTGCLSVTQTTTDDGKIQVNGQWPDGRIGIFREANGKDRKTYGGHAVGEKGEMAIGQYEGYDVLLIEIVKMFRSGITPVSHQEMLELYAFMTAAQLSQEQGGKEIQLQNVIDEARKLAADR
jgi:predicted dehydrogenase